MAVNILIGPSKFGEHDKTPIDMLKKAGIKIISNPYGRKLEKDELAELLKGGVMGIIAGLESLERDILEKSSLKVISRSGAGLSNVDLETASKLGIIVKYTPYGPTESVAELTIGAMISLLRRLSETNNDMHAGKWSKKAGLELAGKKVAVIGFGRIGKRVSQILSVFHAKVLAVDSSNMEIPDFARKANLDEALREADVISVHVSGEEEVLGEREFSIVRKGAYVLNAARGKCVNEKALLKAIDEKRIKGAWIDAFQEEPYSGILTKRTDVLLTPHIGSYTLECRKRMEKEAAENLLSGLKEAGLI